MKMSIQKLFQRKEKIEADLTGNLGYLSL